MKVKVIEIKLTGKPDEVFDFKVSVTILRQGYGKDNNHNAAKMRRRRVRSKDYLIFKPTGMIKKEEC